MKGKIPQWLCGIGVGLTLSACVAAQKPPSANDQPYAGWYMEHAGQGTFQPCGQSAPLRVSTPADLANRARAFGLDEDTPVYVRLRGRTVGDVIEVSGVEQFGSPTPIRNCGMNGVAIPSSP